MIHQTEPNVGQEEVDAVNKYLSAGGWLTEFRETEKFEQLIADFLKVKYVTVVPNGTIGLYLAIRVAGLGNKHTIAVPALTMVATINSVLWAGAKPDLIDISPDTLCMDISKIDPSKVHAVMYVNLNGRSNQLNYLAEFCHKHRLILIEDACQAFGSKFKGKFLGTFGKLGVFSLSPHKIITTGQGGIIVTNDIEMHRRIRKLKDFGRIGPGVDWHDTFGYNFKFTDVQAVIGQAQFSKLGYFIKRKKEIFARYRQLLTKELVMPACTEEEVPWFMDVLCRSEIERDSLAKYLKSFDICTRPMYPAMHLQPVHSERFRGDFPVANSMGKTGLWLPSSTKLTDDQISFIAEKVNFFYEGTTL